MTRTVIDVDDEALTEAARYLGTSTKKDTVNAALREINDRRRRAAAIERMRQMVADGRVDLDLIDENATTSDPTGQDPADAA
ncbi:type II toxin-antitoxin system VapB family antitoxin [Streptomyces sp. WMMC500]|uniref:type II toxin-antitoxin system VapB family antitoxin n=1 Tax=Streptomyces sp. WMMC500 TaxID=3015154 RepID=UPI00248B03D7|nr:type II toxin-antitoxin system VapB family antitoxin [Streptomyces sp. WMMC500]WBB64285.1 type II toxin-antitoxin system VapB family antitoxin [Streptomyces sp. WMMC500]